MLPEYVEHDGHVWKRVYNRIDDPPKDVPHGRQMLRITYAWPWDLPEAPEWPRPIPVHKR